MSIYIIYSHAICHPHTSIQFLLTFIFHISPNTLNEQATNLTMRLSCNGCRVLRKGCSASCTIRPCLQWIQSPDSQANATLFLAKFYGRAGLINLINAGLPHLRPVIFKSLLYESCGRIANPTFGATGLFSSGNWHLCEAAVEAVLKGAPIVTASSESCLSGGNDQALKACDIRHVVRNLERSGVSDRLHPVAKSRKRFKRSGLKPKPEVDATAKSEMVSMNNSDGPLSHESGSSRKNPTWNSDVGGEADTDGDSVETVEASTVIQEEQVECSDLELELTLGFAQWGPVKTLTT